MFNKCPTPVDISKEVQESIQVTIPSVIGEMFDKAYQYDDIMRLMNNRFAKYQLSIVKTLSYWAVGELGAYTKHDSFTEAFGKALDRYLELELEKGINEHPS